MNWILKLFFEGAGFCAIVVNWKPLSISVLLNITNTHCFPHVFYGLRAFEANNRIVSKTVMRNQSRKHSDQHFNFPFEISIYEGNENLTDRQTSDQWQFLYVFLFRLVSKANSRLSNNIRTYFWNSISFYLHGKLARNHVFESISFAMQMSSGKQILYGLIINCFFF